MKVYAYIVKDPKITSGYGTRKDPITGKKATHHGIDVVSKDKNRNIYCNRLLLDHNANISQIH